MVEEIDELSVHNSSKCKSMKINVSVRRSSTKFNGFFPLQTFPFIFSIRVHLFVTFQSRTEIPPVMIRQLIKKENCHYSRDVEAV